MPRVYSPSGIVATIGNTPLVKLTRFAEHYKLPQNCSLFAKLECFNPGGSKKDRVALQLVVDALESKVLKPGQPIVELTSGNTGTGLAIVSKAYGHPFTAVMSKGNTQERVQQMRAFGANILLVDQHPSSRIGQVSGADLALVAKATDELVKQSGAFRADQFSLASSWRAHYLHTAPECWRYLQSSHPLEGIDTFVDFVGTGGTFIGVSKFLKEKNPTIKCMIVEPSNALTLNPEKAQEPDSHSGHKIQGGGYSKTFDQLPLFAADLSALELIDGYYDVDDKEATEAARILASEEGIFGGYSSGANAIAAVRAIQKQEGRNILFCVCDTGLKYLSTGLYE